MYHLFSTRILRWENNLNKLTSRLTHFINFFSNFNKPKPDLQHFVPQKKVVVLMMGIVFLSSILSSDLWKNRILRNLLEYDKINIYFIIIIIDLIIYRWSSWRYQARIWKFLRIFATGDRKWNYYSVLNK